MNKQFMKKAVSVLSVIILLFSAQTYAQSNTHNPLGQDINAITTAVPFLSIAPDSRAGAMGDIGCATSSDGNSQSYNPAKYAFNKTNSDSAFPTARGCATWLTT